MSTTRGAYLVAADSAADLLRDPAVTGSWGSPSALTGFSVGGLAAHLAGQVLFVPETLALPRPDGDVVSLLGHYERVLAVRRHGAPALLRALSRGPGDRQAGVRATAKTRRNGK
jgi:hypothetical protein